MKTTIEIDCVSKDELLIHLDVIKQEIIEKFYDTEDDAFHHSDNNCYGTHTLDIIIL